MFDLIQPILVLVIGWLVRKAFEALDVELDAGTFNAIVAAIVVYLLGLIGLEQAALLF